MRALVLCASAWIAGCGGAESTAEPPSRAPNGSHALNLAFADRPAARAADGSGDAAARELGPVPGTGSPELVAPVTLAPVAPTPPQGRGRAGGRRIDLDVHDADVAEVCRLLADVGHVNVVVGDGVAGKVTARLRAVPWDVALGAILESKGLTMRREGDVIVVMAGH
jgi:hypothetical protein